MEIDPLDDRAVYKQLADRLRERIERGTLRPGDRLPTELSLIQEYGLSRDSVRKAMAILRQEGLIITTPRGSQVRPEPDWEELPRAAGLVTTRMPTAEERRRLAIKEGTPVLVVTAEDGTQEVYRGDEFAVRITPSRE